MFFKKKKATIISFVKTTELSITTDTTFYSTQVNGQYVNNSLSSDKEKAELFFESYVLNNGVCRIVETLRKEEIPN